MLELQGRAKTSATTYHVDPISGDDAADGAARPWKTWRRFGEVARPGDRLLLKRGCTFALPLPIVGGAAGRPITYGAYGEGSRPRLLGNLQRLSRPEDWREGGPGIWQTSTDLPDVANVILGGACGHMRYTLEDLQLPGQWHQHGSGAGPLFLRSSGNPASAWPTVEVILAGNGITLEGPQQSHIHFEDLALRKVGTHGIQLMNNTSDVQIRRCDLSLIGGATYRCDGFSIRYGQRFVDRRVRFGNGIETWESVSDVLVEGCRVSDIFDGGICIQGFNGSTAERILVRDNVLGNCGYDSLDVAHGVLTRDLEFAHNTCAFAGEGWALQGEPKPR